MVKRLYTKDFLHFYSKVPRLCVDLIIKNNDGVLLTKRNIAPYEGKWHLPGGTVLLKESLYAAAKRIARDELNIKIKPLTTLGEIEFINDSQKHIHDVSIVVLVKQLSQKIKLNNQATDYKFFKSAPKNTLKNHALFIKNHLRN